MLQLLPTKSLCNSSKSQILHFLKRVPGDVFRWRQLLTGAFDLLCFAVFGLLVITKLVYKLI